MNSKLKFDKNEIKQANKAYKKVNPIKEQEDIINNLIDIGVKHISISRNAFGHFVLEAIKQWQKNSGQLLQNIKEMTPEDRVNSVSAILDLVKIRLINILVMVDQKAMVEQAIEAARIFYIEQYSARIA